jgi:hypothetical protein
MTTKHFFDQLKLDLSVISGTRALNPIKVNEYLSLAAEREREIIEKTRYITYDEFYRTIARLLKDLPPKFNLFLPTVSMTSEHWIVALFWPWLRTRCVDIVFLYEDVRNKLPIVFIDDCIYSGVSIWMDIEKFLQDINHIDNTIYLAIGYVNMKAVHRILKNFDEIKIHLIYGEEIYPIIDNNCPVYFDHIIACAYSSFPHIYAEKSLLHHPVTKDYKDKLIEAYKQYVKETNNNFLLFPFLTKN